MKKLIIIMAIAIAGCTAAQHLPSGKYVITSVTKEHGLATVTLFGVNGKFVFPDNDSLAVNKEITVFTIQH